MNLTSISQIRSHLYRLNIGEGEIRNQSIRLAADNYTTFPHAHIVSASETVKAVVSTIPFSENIVMGSEPSMLSHQHIVAGTFVCANDSSISGIYQENLDFTVDYPGGKIIRVDGGSIPDSKEVVVWYLYYHIYQRNTDYYFDYEKGRIRRISSGGIEEGQELLVDYRLGNSEFSDSEIEQCIIEAEAEIMHLIDPDFLESTDPALQTAATCLSLSLLCRNSAGITATGLGGADSYSNIWLELARSYRETAMRLLTWFRKEAPDLKAPRLA